MATSNKEVVTDAARTQEGETLRQLLADKGYTHAQLGVEAAIGTKGYVSQLLSGHRPLNVETAARIARTLGVRIEEFSPRLAQVVREAYNHVGQLDAYPQRQEPPMALHRASDNVSILDFVAQGWPFASVTAAQYSQISEGGRLELEAIARGMYIESQRRGKSSGG